MKKIFVQIAAYRDPECTQTVRDLFKKAKFPENINVAICWQYTPGIDDNLLEIDSNHEKQVKLDIVDIKNSLGVCWARNRIQKHYSGEDYTLMIDSHMRFIENWDEAMIDELKKCDSDKPLISNHPAGYTPPNNLDADAKVTILKVKPFNKYGDIRISGELLDKNPETPLKSAFVAAGFIFTLGKVINEVPYDPYYYFDQEEICLSARLWTHGWDIYAPSKNMIYHYYLDHKKPKSRSLHWEDHKNWSDNAKISRERYFGLLSIRDSESQEALKDIDKYNLGNTRSLSEYEEFCGIDFKNFEANKKALGAGFIKNLSQYRKSPINTNLANEKPDFYKENLISENTSSTERFNDKDIYNNYSFNPDFLKNKEVKPPFNRVTENIPEGILVLENFLDEKNCKYLCDYIDNEIGRNLEVLDNENSTETKVATKASSGRITEYVPIDKVAGEIVPIFTDIYVNRLSPFYNTKFEWLERPQILRYLPGGKYDKHADAEHLDKKTKQWIRSQDRDYSVLLYLNEEFEGGHVHFPNFDFRIKPKMGMLLAFPADHKYLHAAEPLISGKRYVIVSWGAILGSKRVKEKQPYASINLNIPR